MKPAVVITLFILGIMCSLWLKSGLDLSEASFMVLVIIAAIFSILIPNLGQLKSFSITKGELILQEVKDSEAAVKELAIATLELVEASSDGSIVTEDYDSSRYDNAVNTIKSLTEKK
jgi:competence protein ComGC